MKRILALVCTLSFLTACGKSGSSTAIPDNTSESEASAGTEAQTETPAAELFRLSDHLNSEGLSVNAIYGISGSRYLITDSTDDSYRARIIDTSTGEASGIVSIGTLPVCSPEGFWVLSAGEDGVQTMFPVGAGYSADRLLVYDYDLNKTVEVDLRNDSMLQCIDVDIPGKSIYYTYNTFDGASEKHTLERLHFDVTAETVFEIPYTHDRDNWLCALYNIKYTPEQFIFLGSVSPRADGSAQSVAAYGTLVPGSAPDYVYRSDTYNNEMEKFCGGAIVHDGGLPFGVAPSGFVEYFKGTERRIITLQNPYETPHIYPSQNGSFFATALEGKNEDGTSIFRITVYDCEGNVLKTEDCSLTASGVIQNACVNEYSRRVFYQIGSGGVLRWNEFTF